MTGRPEDDFVSGIDEPARYNELVRQRARQMTEGVVRYTAWPEIGPFDAYYVALCEDDDGNVILYEDHAAIVAALTASLEQADRSFAAAEDLLRSAVIERDRLRELVALAEKALEGAAKAGWDACRKSIYAVCEATQDQADAMLDKPSGFARGPLESQHEQGFYRGEKSAAKSIARGFNAMEAEDDNNFVEALTKLQASHEE